MILPGPGFAPPPSVPYAQIQQQMGVLAQQREMYLRCVALLAKSLETGADVGILHIDGKIAVRAKDWNEVPKNYAVNFKLAKYPHPDPEVKEEDVMILEITPPPERSKLVVPGAN